MRRILPILIICITSCINSAYAVRIHGTILSATDNETASNAIIYAYDSQNKKIKSIVADIDGKFDANVPDNTVAVEIGFLSHPPQTVPATAVTMKTMTE